MHKELLDRFFEENTVESDTPTAPAFAHFYISLENKPEAKEAIQAIMDEAVYKEQPEREVKVLAERHEIETAETCEEMIRIMRRNTDPMNQHTLINRTMAFEDEIIPEIVRMLKTSMNDGFIETSIRILAKSGRCVADELFGCFDDMRYPYAQSMVLVLLGFKADETRISWFIDKFKDLKRRYPDESYHEGAHYALSEISDRLSAAEQADYIISRV